MFLHFLKILKNYKKYAKIYIKNICKIVIKQFQCLQAFSFGNNVDCLGNS